MLDGRRMLALTLVTLLLAASSARAGGDWNDAGIGWKSYDDGLAAAKKAKKPVCLVFFTEWCPHCTNYSKLFHDPKVVEKSKSFVMIRLDKDKNQELSQKFAPDGQYIPRTFFLSPAGELAPTIHAARDKYLYFYDESNPGPLLAAMDEAQQKLR